GTGYGGTYAVRQARYGRVSESRLAGHPTVDRHSERADRCTRLTRIIHERFYCNREFAAATSLRRAGSPLPTSTYCFKYASVPRDSACPSRHATARFRHEPP